MASEAFKFKIPILGCNVMVCFCEAQATAQALIAKFIGVDQLEAPAAAYVLSEKDNIGVWIGPECNGPGGVVHECFHIVNDAYGFTECKMGADEEMDALFLEYVCDKVIPEWEKRNNG